MINKIISKKFYNKKYITKQKKLQKYILQYSDCNIGDVVLCFEDRNTLLVWTTPSRFLGKLALRKEKLLKLNKKCEGSQKKILF